MVKKIVFLVLFIAAGMTRDKVPILSEILIFIVIVWSLYFLCRLAGRISISSMTLIVQATRKSKTIRLMIGLVLVLVFVLLYVLLYFSLASASI